MAITGMGGIGKTQTVIEYAYRYAHTYQTILWTTADSYEALISDFHSIAQTLRLPEQRISDQKRLVQTVKQWLQEQRDWLFLFDNVENLAMIKDFLPQRGRGSVLLTTRTQILGPLAQKVDLEKLSQEEGATFILRRAKLLHGDDLLKKAKEHDQEKAREIAVEMDGLPLALDQAAAYIEETQCSVAEYLDLYRTRRTELLQRRGESSLDHPDSVVTTFSLSFEKIEQENPVAADILRLCSFLHAEDIPDEIITSGSARVEAVLQKLAASFSEAHKSIPAEIAATLASEADNLLRRAYDPLCYHQAMQTLLKYSFIRRNTPERTLSTHRLVQAVMKDSMEKQTQLKWAGRTIRAVESILTILDAATPRLKYFIAQAFTCTRLIEQWNILEVQSINLLMCMETLLLDRDSSHQMEPLSIQDPLDVVRGEAFLPINEPGWLTRFFIDQKQYLYTMYRFQRILKVHEIFQGREHFSLIPLLNTLGYHCLSRQKIDLALAYSKRIISIYTNKRPPASLEDARSMSLVAHLYVYQHKYQTAETLYQKALQTRQHFLGPEHPDCAENLNDLAKITALQGKIEQAESYSKKALLLSVKTQGRKHARTARSLETIGIIATKQKNFLRAEKFLRRALTIRQQTLESYHIEIARNHQYLAQVYQEQKKETEARHHFQLASTVSGMIANTRIPDLFPVPQEHLFMLPTEVSLGISVTTGGASRHFPPSTNEMEAPNDPKPRSGTN